MKLQEVFKQPYGWDWLEQEDDTWLASFDTDEGHSVQVRFVVLDKETQWRVDFIRYNPEYDDWSESITGEGDAFRIFGTVAQIVNSFIQIHPAANFLFGVVKSSEQKRLSLYKRLFDKTLPENWSASSQSGTLVLMRRK